MNALAYIWTVKSNIVFWKTQTDTSPEPNSSSRKFAIIGGAAIGFMITYCTYSMYTSHKNRAYSARIKICKVCTNLHSETQTKTANMTDLTLQSDQKESNQCNRLNPQAFELFTKHWGSNKHRNHAHKAPIYPKILCGQTLLLCIHHKPNIFVIENFLCECEITHLLKICRNNMKHFELSYTQPTDSRCQQIYSAQRTSTNLFLPKSVDIIITSIENRAANVVGVANKSVEPLQIVRYINGQHFDLHHDAGTLKIENPKQCNQSGDEWKHSIKKCECDYCVDIMSPSRICSFFVYLTSATPKNGGETYFPKIGLKMRPQRGTALLWCNVEADNVLKADPMLIHKAFPVIGNHEKIGMNIWINQ